MTIATQPITTLFYNQRFLKSIFNNTRFSKKKKLKKISIKHFLVPPGAHDRLVQVSGPTESKVKLAKGLIEETIRRNQSPDIEHGFGQGEKLT